MDFVFGLFFVEVTIELELFFFFIFGWRRKKEEGKHNIISLLALYFLCLAIGRIILIFYDYELPLEILWVAGSAVSLLGMIFFIFLAENIIPKNTHYLFTILSVATVLSIFFVNLQTAKNILYGMIPFIFLIGFIFLGYLIRKTVGSVRFNFTLIFLGQLLFGFGTGFNTDWISGWFLDELLFNISPIGLTLIIGGLGLIALAFWRLPSFSEIEWHSKMLNLFVITAEHGICCLFHSFQKPIESKPAEAEPTEPPIVPEKAPLAPQLISGGVAGIIALVKEMTSSKMHLKSVDHEDVKILFEYGLYSTAVLLAEEDLQIYHDKLKRFMEAFELKFKQNLVDWTGDIHIFKEAAEIVAHVFEQKLEDLERSANQTAFDVTI